MFHLEAIKLISGLRGAVQNTPEARGMALGQYIAGMFSNVGLTRVHSMAHGLSA